MRGGSRLSRRLRGRGAGQCGLRPDPRRAVRRRPEEHLPPLFDAAEARGPITRHSLERLGQSGKKILDDLGDLTGVELACVGTAAEELLATFSVFDVVVNASLDVTVTTSNECE